MSKANKPLTDFKKKRGSKNLAFICWLKSNTTSCISKFYFYNYNIFWYDFYVGMDKQEIPKT